MGKPGKNGNGRAGVAALLINSFEFHVGRMLELESVIGAGEGGGRGERARWCTRTWALR